MKKLSVGEYQKVDTPSNPDGGFMKMYFKSDGFLYYLDENGVESKVADTNGVVDTTSNQTVGGQKIFTENVEISNAGGGLILTDANGNRYLLSVNTNGNLELNSL